MLLGSKTWGPGIRSRKAPGTGKIRYDGHRQRLRLLPLEDYVAG